MNKLKKDVRRRSKAESASTDAKLIENSVKFINEKANETLYKGSVEIGEYVLRHFFNDDIHIASSRNPRKPKSYKALCEHRDLSVPYSTLTIMVRVAAQERFFKQHDFDLKKLSYTHKANLIKLENNENKIYLARECIQKELTTRQLSRLVSKEKKTLIEYKKSLQDEGAFKNILKIEQLINRSEKSELITDMDKLKGMRSKTRANLRNKADKLLKQMAQTTKECKSLLKKLDKLEKK